MSELHQKSRNSSEIAALTALRDKWIDLRDVAHRYFPWALVLGEFGAVQVLVQGCLAIGGLLIVRTLSKEEYAFFVIANSMQVACNLLADLGIGIALRSIGGRVLSDRARFGQLLNTALNLRGRFALLSFTFCLPIAAWMLWHNGASMFVTVSLCAVTAAGTVPLLFSSVWALSPVLHGEYRCIQKLDLASAVLRLLLIGTLAFFWMTACLAALVAVIINWIQLLVLRRFARRNAEFEASVNLDDRREMIRLSLKSLPNSVFFCFQGQVTLLVLTLLGSPAGLADFTALGRITALFSIFSMAFDNVLAPRFARCQQPARLRKLYLLLAGGAALAYLPLVGIAYILPGPFLWLLGSKYADLEYELVLMVMAACIGQIGGVMWNLNSSKAWVGVQVVGFIPAIVAVQALTAFLLDLRQFHNVLIFNLAVTAAPLPILLWDTFRGLRGMHQVG